MSNIDYQALREAAQLATQGEWVAFISSGTGTYAVHTPGDKRCEDVIKWTGFDGQKNAENNARYIAAFNPEVVQALLDERERNQQYIKLRDQENEDIALTVGKLRVELEGKDSKIANLTAERDALREGEMGDARHSNTRAAADIYFQLVEECEIPAGGSLVEYVDDMREKLEAAEKRIAELEAREVREEGNQFLVVRHPGKAPVIKHSAGDLEGFLRQLLEHEPMATIDIVTHRYYGVGGQWVQDADEYLQMMNVAAGKGDAS
ncbi:ead/Ea22-like family protein [Escherichia coli]|nr:ead/Ea22-like family protein [Escherichia coli]